MELVIILVRGVLLFLTLFISPRKELSQKVGREIKSSTLLLLIHQGWIPQGSKLTPKLLQIKLSYIFYPKGWICLTNPGCSHS